MNGFIEERVKKLKSNSVSGLAALLICGIFLTALGIGALVLVYILTAEDRRMDFIMQGLVFSMVPLLPGLFLLFLYFKRNKQRSAVKENPLAVVKLYGFDSGKESAARAFNEEYAGGKLRFETYDKLVSAQGFWLTDSYALSDMGTSLDLGQLSSVKWVCFCKTAVIIQKQSYESWQYLLFFDSEGAKPDIMMLPCTKRTYQEAGGALEALGFSVSYDKKLHNLACKDWQAFKRDHLAQA